MKKTFTLIELLVVIAIIAILAAMLFPAIGKVKALGVTMTCLNNQKQYGVSNISYANDFDVLPHHTEHIKVMVFDYKLPYTTIRCPFLSQLKKGYGYKALSLKGQTPNRVTTSESQYYWANPDFGINPYLAEDGDHNPRVRGKMLYHRIYRPAYKLMICDTEWENGNGHYHGYWNLSGYIRVRHEDNKVLPMIYADGHGAKIDTGVYHANKKSGVITTKAFIGSLWTKIDGGVARIYSGRNNY